MRLVLVVLVLASPLAAVGCNGDSGTSPTPYLQTDVRVGTGAEATVGRRATVNYTGWIYDPSTADNKGRQFDSSVGAGRKPFMMTIGAGQVIPGFDRGVTGMRVGGMRRVVIPPDLGYGSNGQKISDGVIPPNATLVVDIELLEVA